MGRYVVDALADSGERVLGFTEMLLPTVSERTDTALCHLFDLPRMLHGLREHGVDRVVHAADAADPGLSIAMPVATVVSNLEGTLHLLEAARLAGIPGRIVLLSSISVYGHNSGPIDELTPPRPRTPYAVAKLTGEHLGATYSDLYGLDVVVLRMGELFGPELVPPAGLATAVRAAARGEVHRAPVGHDQTFHLTHGEDAARAILAALAARNPKRRVYNITGGETQTFGRIAALLRDRFPKSRIDAEPGRRLLELDRQASVDISAADRELGYRPLWGLARGLDDYVEWLLAQREAA